MVQTPHVYTDDERALARQLRAEGKSASLDYAPGVRKCLKTLAQAARFT